MINIIDAKELELEKLVNELEGYEAYYENTQVLLIPLTKSDRKGFSIKKINAEFNDMMNKLQIEADYYVSRFKYKDSSKRLKNRTEEKIKNILMVYNKKSDLEKIIGDPTHDDVFDELMGLFNLVLRNKNMFRRLNISDFIKHNNALSDVVFESPRKYEVIEDKEDDDEFPEVGSIESINQMHDENNGISDDITYAEIRHIKCRLLDFSDKLYNECLQNIKNGKRIFIIEYTSNKHIGMLKEISDSNKSEIFKNDELDKIVIPVNDEDCIKLLYDSKTKKYKDAIAISSRNFKIIEKEGNE